MNNIFKNKYLLQIISLCLLLLGMSSVHAAEHCADSYSIDQTLASGARWDMCWTHNNNHGIRYHHIYYTPKNGTRRMVLREAAISQIHVPYDDNGARYHDVSDFGLGGGYLRSLSAAECSGGVLRQYGSKNAVCTQAQKNGAAYRFGSQTVEANVLKVFSASKVGKYIYMPQWLFYDDGRMEPSILATGALQRFHTATNSTAQGWLMSGNRIGLSHMHNYFWRLDFDLNGTANNDVAKEINYTAANGKRERSMTTFNSEVARALSPSQDRSWLISDGSQRNAKNHLMGYEIRLSEAGHREIGPSYEAYTHNDFYVTRANNCEQIASHNSRINRNCSDSLDQFVNGQSLTGQDLIAWVGISFYHMPRSEDYPKMDVHSNKFEIIPRDWHAQSPLGTVVIDTPLEANPDNVNASGDLIIIDVLANDTGNGIELVAPNAWSSNGGQVSLENNKIAYTAKPGFNGTDKIYYSLTDSQGGNDWTVVTITVSGNNSSNNPYPAAQNDAVSSATAGELMTIDVLANDTGNGLVLIAPHPWSQKGGAVALVSNKLNYTAKSSYTGVDKIWYTFNDIEGRRAWGEVTINVSGGVYNPAPVGNPDTANASSGDTITIDALANDIGNGLVLSLDSAYSQKGGKVTLLNNTLRYIPQSGYTGVDKIWYTIIDIEGRGTWGEVTINVSGGGVNNPAPVSNPDRASASSGSTITIDVLANDIGNGLVFSLNSDYSQNGGNVSLSGNKISYKPKVGFVGVDKIWYTLQEVEGRTSWGEVTITVTP